MDMTTLAMGMMIGSSVAYALDYFLGVSSAVRWQERSEDTVLKLLIICLESTSYMQTLKIKTMKDMGVEENVIKLTKNVDELAFATWKKSMVEAINVAYQGSYTRHHFYDWNGVLDYAEKLWRKNAESKRGRSKEQ